MKFQLLVENQLEKKIKVFQSDGGGEFTSNAFKLLLEQKGIHYQFSCPYTPQQNGVVEQKHRHVVETVLSLLFQSHMPLRYWVDAFLTTTFLINQMPSSILGILSLFQKINEKSPKYNNIKIFGCRCFHILGKHS